jgi:hypothetical protein
MLKTESATAGGSVSILEEDDGASKERQKGICSVVKQVYIVAKGAFPIEES